MLKKQMDDAWCFLSRAMDGVDDIMLHWAPSPGSWGLRLKGGRWRLDYHLPDPIPPGPKTIGWLAAHLATCKEMHGNILFGDGRMDWDDLVIPGDAEGLKQYLNKAHQDLRRGLESLEDDDLIRQISTTSNSGEKLYLWQALWFDIHHDFEHGGQIFQVRNEYTMRCRPSSERL